MNSLIPTLTLGERAKARALRMLMVAGFAGFLSVYGSIDWLTSHDAGDPHQ